MVSTALLELYMLEDKYGGMMQIPDDELLSVRHELDVPNGDADQTKVRRKRGRPKGSGKTSKRVIDNAAKVEVLYARGTTVQDICKQLDLSKAHVHQLVRRFGLNTKYNYQDYRYKVSSGNEEHYFRNIELLADYFGLNSYRTMKKFKQNGQINGFKLEVGKFHVKGETHDANEDDAGR